MLRAGGGIERLAGETLRVTGLAVRRSERRMCPLSFDIGNPFLFATCDLQKFFLALQVHCGCKLTPISLWPGGAGQTAIKKMPSAAIPWMI